MVPTSIDVDRWIEVARVPTPAFDVVLRVVGRDADKVTASARLRHVVVETAPCDPSVRFDLDIAARSATAELAVGLFWAGDQDGEDSFEPTCNFAELVSNDMLLAIGCREFDHEAGRLPPGLRVPARWYQAVTAFECYRIRPGYNGFAVLLGPLAPGETLTLPFAAAFCGRGPQTDRDQARRAAAALLMLPYPDEIPS